MEETSRFKISEEKGPAEITLFVKDKIFRKLEAVKVNHDITIG